MPIHTRTPASVVSAVSVTPVATVVPGAADRRRRHQGQSGQRVALQASAVAIIEAEPQREVLHSVVIDVDPELVERFRVKAGGGNVTGESVRCRRS